MAVAAKRRELVGHAGASSQIAASAVLLAGIGARAVSGLDMLKKRAFSVCSILNKDDHSGPLGCETFINVKTISIGISKPFGR